VLEWKVEKGLRIGGDGNEAISGVAPPAGPLPGQPH
jgi:hypothetical protein